MDRAGSNISAPWFVGVACCLLCVYAGPAFAQATQTGDAASADSGVQLRLSTRSTAFYEGEVIPLELAFSSTTPKRYRINNASYDRSGRMSHEEFIIEPEDGT